MAFTSPNLAEELNKMNKEWSNLAKVVYTRTYSREKEDGVLENWEQTVDRVVEGNIRSYKGTELLEKNEENKLKDLILNRKAMPAGRGLWFSGADRQEELKATALTNCYVLSSADWQNFSLAMDLLMLGGGVGMTVEHKYTSKLPRIQKNVKIINLERNDVDFIVPDSREGWVQLTRKVLRSYFETGESFSYSCVLIRGRGEPIKGFGGKASGKVPLIEFISKLCVLLDSKAGKRLHPIDAADILCMIGEVVVAGNTRRSAILIQGDPFDKEFLKAKRWDLGGYPAYRAMANYSVNCSDIDDLHPLFWKTYEHGEPFGIVNVDLANKYGRIGELKKDTAIATNPCFTIDTKILTRKGWRTFEELLGKEAYILQDARVSSNAEDNWVVDVAESGTVSNLATEIRKTGKNKEIYKLITYCGRSVKATLDHKFATPNGMKMLSELSFGDTVLLPFPTIPNIDKDSDDWKLGYITGFMFSEGHCTNNDTLYIPVNYLNEATEKVEKYAKDLLADVDSTRLCKDPKFKESTAEYIGYGFSSTFLGKRIINELGYKNKESIAFVHQHSKNLKAGFISGFIANRAQADSHMGYGVIVIDHKVFEVLEDIQLILQELGIMASLIKNTKNPFLYNQTNTLSISNRQNIENSKRVISYENSMLEKLKTPSDISIGRYFFTGVAAVKYVGTEDVYCLKEDNRRTLIANGLTARRCGEQPLPNYGACNLAELVLSNIDTEEELYEAARLMYRYVKRVSMEGYIHKQLDDEVIRSRRVGIGITGCLQSPLFTKDILDKAYKVIQEEDKKYSALLGVNESIRLTTVKPSGTISLICDTTAGIHPAYSRYYIRRVRFDADDKLVSVLRKAGHHIEPVENFPNTVVVDFPCKVEDGTPVADEDWTMEKQLDTVTFSTQHWSDSAVSVTVYYNKDEIYRIKDWLRDNLANTKSISFLCHSEHGFSQAPYEAITQEQYDKINSSITPIDFKDVNNGSLESMECEGGICPIK